MTVGVAIILGLLQGLTEFIPVSSSGHLVIAQYFLGLPPSPVFDQLINLGTFLALIVYFRKKLWDMCRRLFVNRDYKQVRNILISALPVGILGLFFSDFFEQPFIQSPWVVAFTLTSIGLIMILAEKIPRANSLAGSSQLSVKRAVAIGLAQASALIPGVSRSGSTILAGRSAGLSFAQAAEYSFLLSIPVMAGVVLKGFISDRGREFIAANTMPWLVGNVAAFISGLVAVGFMLRFLERSNLKIFGYYRIALAVVVVITAAYFI